ncbi:MAG TPA: monofunctional biosynthetic peptidoglycan transglycosylase [Candidatus Macondimonas sp.]|nr:monofunctional biosynthetic peptidoglycan transglycosylase [Candidatus Macondimonas sp.]
MPMPPPWSPHARRRPAPGSRRRPAGRLRRALWASLLALLGLTVLPIGALRWLSPPTSAFMLQQGIGNLMSGEWIWPDYRWVPRTRISAAAALAVVAAEDQRFPTHFGLDLEAIRDAVDHNARGGPVRGASTLTQQTAKNLFLWSGRSWARKGLEAWLALWMELLLPKGRILELYLNVAQFGDKVYGVEAASQHYFGIPAARLDPAQAALLAAVLPNPVRYRIDAPSAYVRRRQAWILGQMRQLGPDYLSAL